MKNFYTVETQNFLKVLQKSFNILVLFHPLESQEKFYFITSNFNPAQNIVFEHYLQGKDITDIINSGNYDRSFAADFSQEGTHNVMQLQTLSTKFDVIPVRTYKFSKDFTYIWYLQS